MARERVTAGSLVLDSQGLSKYFEQDHDVINLVRFALQRGAERVISAATLLEAQNPSVKRARREFVLSQLTIAPLSVMWAREAAQLLQDRSLSGHLHALDAMVTVTALHQSPPVVLVTSDPDDMTRLCGGRVSIVRV